jgi:hypothetical protein
MPTIYDRSGNGNRLGINVGNSDAAIAAGVDTTIDADGYVRVETAGDFIYRSAGSTTDITIPAENNEYIPVSAGDVVRSSSTATGMVWKRSR